MAASSTEGSNPRSEKTDREASTIVFPGIFHLALHMSACKTARAPQPARSCTPRRPLRRAGRAAARSASGPGDPHAEPGQPHPEQRGGGPVWHAVLAPLSRAETSHARFVAFFTYRTTARYTGPPLARGHRAPCSGDVGHVGHPNPVGRRRGGVALSQVTGAGGYPAVLDAPADPAGRGAVAHEPLHPAADDRDAFRFSAREILRAS